MAAIFYHNEMQQKLALETKAFEEKRRNKEIRTEILPFGIFYLAEDYHQKYQLRQHRELMTEFKAMYSQNDDFINSTAAARINGYVSGHGSPEEIKVNLKSLGLSTGGQQRLLEFANNWKN